MLHRKERLIKATIEIIDQFGILELTTKEIAKREKVSEATLFRHFASKNELLKAVLDYFSEFDDEIFLSAKSKGLKPTKTIIYLIQLYIEYYQANHEITSIMQLIEVFRYNPDLKEKVKSIFYNRSYHIKQLVEDAQKAGEISSDIDSESITNVISGFCRETCLKWRIEDQKFLSKDKILSTLEFFLDGFSVNQTDNNGGPL